MFHHSIPGVPTDVFYEQSLPYHNDFSMILGLYESLKFISQCVLVRQKREGLDLGQPSREVRGIISNEKEAPIGR